MLQKRHLDRYSESLLWGLKKARRDRFKKNDIVLIRYDIAALKLAEVLYGKILEMGINPVLRTNPTPFMEQTFYEFARRPQLRFTAPGAKTLLRHLHGSIFLHAPASVTHLAGADPRKIGMAAAVKKTLRDVLSEREEQGRFGWTLCVFPTEALASQAKLTLEDYEGQVIKACFLNKTDPVSKWQELYDAARSIKKWLDGMRIKHFHIESDGIDLEITPGEQRKWVGISGRNIPSFEIFLSPDWRGTRGVYYADQPSYRTGNLVEGVRLEFKNGDAVAASAREGEIFLKSQMAMDKGARRIGEFSLTDKRFSKIDRFMANTLYDENHGGRFGNCHVALGAAYSNTYAGNPAELTRSRKAKLGFNDSILHWDLVNTQKKRVTARLASGERVCVYENGLFKY